MLAEPVELCSRPARATSDWKVTRAKWQGRRMGRGKRGMRKMYVGKQGGQESDEGKGACVSYGSLEVTIVQGLVMSACCEQSGLVVDNGHSRLVGL